MIDPAKDNKKGSRALWPQPSLRSVATKEERSSNEGLNSDDGL